MPRLRHSFLYNAAYQVLLIITPLITTPYLSRVLEPTGVGVYSYTSSITQYFVLFATLGMSTYGVRLVATRRHNREQLSKAFWSAYASQLLISSIVLVIYLIYWIPDPKGGHKIAFFWCFWIISAALNASWLLFGVEEFKIPTIRNVVVKILELVLIFTLVKSYEDLWIYVIIIAGGYLLSQLLVLPFIPRYVDFYRPSWAEISAHFRPSLRLFVPVIAISLYTVLDKVMLGAISTMVETGYFEYSERIAKIPLAVITALGAVMLPRMSSYFSSNKKEERALGMHVLELSFWFMMIAAFAAAFGIGAIAPEFVPKFLSGTFNPAIPTMIMLAGVVPLIAATNVLGNQYLLPSHKDWLFTLSVLVGAVVNIVLNLILIAPYGSKGAAIATLAAELAVLIAQIVLVRKELLIGRFFVRIVPFFIFGALMAVLVRYVAHVTRGMWGLSYTGLFLEVGIGVVFFLACTLAWLLIRKDSFFFELLRTSGLKKNTDSELSENDEQPTLETEQTRDNGEQVE